jgi:hypothetical protein
MAEKWIRAAGFAATGVAALALAGCSTLSSGTGGDGGDSGGGGENPLLSVLRGYQQTEAVGGLTVSAAQQQGAVGGFGVGTGGATSAVAAQAAASQGTFGVGSVDLSGVDFDAETGNVVVTISDRTYSLPYNGLRDVRDIGGRSGELLGFGNTAGATDGTNSGDGVFLLNSEYVSLAAIVSGGGQWLDDDDPNPQPPGQYFIPGADGYAMLVTGLHTPAGSMPSQTAVYEGQAYFAVVSPDGNGVGFGDQGDFTMNVDFDAGTISGTAYDRVGIAAGVDHTSVQGTIVNGNQFLGTLTRLDVPNGEDVGMNGEIIGGFYGPSAEQVAGTASGKARPEVTGFTEVDATGIFIGSRTE